MPNFRKLDRDEIAQIERNRRLTHVHLESLLDAADVVAGSGIELTLEPGERSSAVRREVKKVLRQRGWMPIGFMTTALAPGP